VNIFHAGSQSRNKLNKITLWDRHLLARQVCLEKYTGYLGGQFDCVALKGVGNHTVPT